MHKTLKAKLKTGAVTVGSWITLGDPSVAEIMVKAGFEWLVVDMEHSVITLDAAQNLIQVIELSGVTPLVRVSENDPVLIKRIMDAGSHGVIVPMINTKVDAMKAVIAVKYPPAGIRGVGLARAQGYGLEFEKYRKRINRDSIVIAQIEHIEAINNLESILSVPGIDCTMLGPYDLSASMGYPGEFDRHDVREAIKRYVSVCGKLGKTAGFHVVQPDTGLAKSKIKEGFRFIAFSVDMLFLGLSAKAKLNEINKKYKSRNI